MQGFTLQRSISFLLTTSGFETVFLAVLAGLELVVLLPVSPKCWDFLLFQTSPPLPPFLLLFLKTETCFKNLQSWLTSNFWGSRLSCLSTMCAITSCRKQYFEFFFKLSLHQLSIDYPKKENFPSMTCLENFCSF